MYKIFVVFVILMITAACSVKKPIPPSPSQKVFEQEDTYIMFALRAEEVQNYKVASKLFYTLYKKAKKKEYLYRSLEDALVAKEYTSVIYRVDEVTDGSFKDPKLVRLKIIALYEQGELQKAQTLARALVKNTQSIDDYILVSDILTKQKQYDLALKYLEGAYVKNYNEKILDKMAIILYVNLHRKKDAIAQLESHTRIHGCSKLICHRLIGIYSNENNIEGLLSTYKRLYQMNKDDNTAKKIIQIYSYKRDYVHLMDFLEATHRDDELLLQLYVAAKDYKKAYPLAQELYESSRKIEYLGQSAIYEYEAKQNNLSKNTLLDIVKKLTKVAQKTNDTLYMNYLGYILIDHEIDVQKGMAYIQKVLQKQPDSAYYLDSLAWGYYKLHQCKQAQKIMQKVIHLEGGDNPEVLFHKQEIENCIKNPQHKKVIDKR